MFDGQRKQNCIEVFTLNRRNNVYHMNELSRESVCKYVEMWSVSFMRSLEEAVLEKRHRIS